MALTLTTRSKHDEIVDLMTKETCKEDKTPASKGLVVQPIVSKEFNSCGQMDLIDMQSRFLKLFHPVRKMRSDQLSLLLQTLPYMVFV
jgi:hypothetical protein